MACCINLFTKYGNTETFPVQFDSFDSCQLWKDLYSLYLSRLVGKPTMWFPNRSDTNRPVQAQKRDRSLKFRNIALSDRVAKTKALISFAVTAKLICAFVFAYEDCWFSHVAAHLFLWRRNDDITRVDNGNIPRILQLQSPYNDAGVVQ